MPAKAKTSKTLDEFAADLKAAGFRVQRDAYGTITAYERGDRPADTTGALAVGESGDIESITLGDGTVVAATSTTIGDPADAIARVDDVPVVLIDGVLHKHHGVDEDGDEITEVVA